MEQRALSVEGFNSFLSKVFMWMFIGLLTTAFTAFVVASTPALYNAIVSNQILFFGLIIGEFALVITLSRNALKYSYQKTIGLFLLYSFVNGLTLSIYLLAYSGQSVASAFIITAVMFGMMALYGYVAKTDLSGFGTFAMFGIIGIIIATIVNMFLGSGLISYIINIAGVVLFAGLTAYDMQKMKSIYTYSVQQGGTMEGNLAVTGALRLYLDFVNMFLFVLRLGRK